jgi:mannose-1-phosphate guanylyltransferase/phosphomannomutase
VVRTAPMDAQSVQIEFFDERGIAIDAGAQRKVERAYFRDDLRRAFHHEVGELTFPARGREYYLQELLDTVNVESIREAAPKLVIDYSFGTSILTAPVLLGGLGVELLAVNGVLDENRAVMDPEETTANLARLAELVRAGGADLGARIDPTGERLYLVDGDGRILPPDRALLVYVDLIGGVTERPGVAVPVATSRVVADLAEARGGRVVSTKISPAALSAASMEDGVVFAGAEGGGYIFPDFLPSYDAVMSLAKLLELLAGSRATLAEVADRVPPTHVVRIDVPTPWEAKGTVMRRLVERLDGERTLTIDGVKVYRDRDWALVVPHPKEPVVRVWAEADGDEEARSLAGEFVGLVEELRG